MKGVIYARYSCDNQREESIEGQLRDCKEYAKRHDIWPLTPTSTVPFRQRPIGALPFNK